LRRKLSKGIILTLVASFLLMPYLLALVDERTLRAIYLALYPLVIALLVVSLIHLNIKRTASWSVIGILKASVGAKKATSTDNLLPENTLAKVMNTQESELITDSDEAAIEDQKQEGICGDSEPSFPKPGIVYLMKRPDGAIKIGITNNIKVRHATIRRQCGDIELLYHHVSQAPRATEKFLHGLLKDRNVGGEWFNLSDVEINAVKKIITEYFDTEQVNRQFFGAPVSHAAQH
jgi:Meiotically up-regulated gene 113